MRGRMWRSVGGRWWGGGRGGWGGGGGGGGVGVVGYGEGGAGPGVGGVGFWAPRGEVVGIVGPTGAGKSTLVGLLPRFFDPDRGRVVLDGRDVRDVRLGQLRG